MGKIQLKKFEIVLSENKNVYQLGDQVIGKCIIGLEGELQLSKVRLKLKGRVEVKWGKVSGRSKIFYKEKINFLTMDYDFSFFNVFNGLIGKGIHEFPFCCQLPNEGIPSSFAGFHGSVKYWIEVEIEKPILSLNHKTRTDFKVEAPLFFDNLMLPLNDNNEKKLGYLDNSGIIRLDININKRGYIPGQSISVSCQITNYSSKRVTPRATLKQIQTYFAKGHQKLEEIKYPRVVGIPVNCGLTDVQTLEVPIPADVQLSLECPIIFVEYILHITTEIPLEMDLHIDLPIIITKGSVLTKSRAYLVKNMEQNQ